MSSDKALLLIPDISGFTNFVKETERVHSQHIISELLSIMIEKGSPEFKVAEVEGDAVFFYRIHDYPDARLILKKAREIFIAFHQHLLLYEHKRVCNCGACSTAVNLSLKIIAHFGEIDFINVNNITKPFGKNIILVHKLLKNKINSNEYLLFTHDFGKLNHLEEAWEEVLSGETYYEDYGNIQYNYISLTPLKNYLSEPAPVNNFKSSKPIIYQIILPCKSYNVFELIANLDERGKWQKGVDKLVFDEKELNRVGSSHICVIGNKNIKFETISSKLDNKEKFIFGEKTGDIPLVKEINTYYIIEQIPEVDTETRLTVEVHVVPYPVFGSFLLPLFNRLMLKNLRDLLEALKQYCIKKENFIEREVSKGDAGIETI